MSIRDQLFGPSFTDTSHIPASVQRAFVGYSREITANWTHNAAVMMFLSVALLWPTDAMIFDGRLALINALTQWRFVVVVCTGFMIMGLRLVPPIRRHPVWLFNCAAMAIMLVSGHAMGRLGGTDNPLFYAIYPVPVTTVALIVTPWQRVLSASNILISYVVGFTLYTGASGRSFLLLGPAIYAICVVIGVVYLGAIVRRLLLINFAQSQSLADHATDLEAEVERQTADLAARQRELQLVLGRLEVVVHEERENLSRNLHDEIGQQILALKMSLFTFRESFGPQLPEDGKQQLANIALISQDIQALTRNVLEGLVPSEVKDKDLLVVLQRLISGVQQYTNLQSQIDWSVPPTIRFTMVTRLTIYRIVQEAITNAINHGHADAIEIVGRYDEAASEVSIEVRDNGRGFDVEEAWKSGRIGLQSMRDRMVAIDGELSVLSTAGDGACIGLRLSV